MTAPERRRYSVRKDGDLLVFSTDYFSEDAGSLLHAGIYNRELASVLSAGAVMTASALFLIIIRWEKVLVPFVFSLQGAVVILIAFTGLFIFFKVFIFRERSLVATFNRQSGQARVLLPVFFGKKKSLFSTGEIRDILIDTRRTTVDNPDAVQFVEKISAQHGMVIPGFGEEKVLFMLKLIMSDGTDRVLYADNSMADVMAAHEELKDFLGLA